MKFMYKNSIVQTKRYKNTAWIPLDCNFCIAKSMANNIKLPNGNDDSILLSPGGRLCNSLDNSLHVNFYTENGEVGFCIFEDNSFINTSGLYQFAKKNTK